MLYDSYKATLFEWILYSKTNNNKILKLKIFSYKHLIKSIKYYNNKYQN